MEIHLLRGNLCTMDRYRFFFWNRHGREILMFFSTQHSLLTSIVFLTIHDTLLIARRIVDNEPFFAMVSNAVDTM